MSMGRPCIATAVDGIPEALTNEVTGLLHAHGDATALAAAIVRLVDEQGFAKTLGSNARGEVERRFGLNRLARDVHALYMRLSRSHKEP
jgi:glycosyltransferase involved in cell wall biosynthesis